MVRDKNEWLEKPQSWWPRCCDVQTNRLIFEDDLSAQGKDRKPGDHSEPSVQWLLRGLRRDRKAPGSLAGGGVQLTTRRATFWSPPLTPRSPTQRQQDLALASRSGRREGGS